MRPQIADLHREMLSQAAAADWSRVAVLSRHRDALLETAPQRYRRTLLEAAIACNQSIIESARAARKSIGDELLEFRRGRRGLARYAENRSI